MVCLSACLPASYAGEQSDIVTVERFFAFIIYIYLQLYRGPVNFPSIYYMSLHFLYAFKTRQFPSEEGNNVPLHPGIVYDISTVAIYRVFIHCLPYLISSSHFLLFNFMHPYKTNHENTREEVAAVKLTRGQKISGHEELPHSISFLLCFYHFYVSSVFYDCNVRRFYFYFHQISISS